jgi:hypothetical protein
LGKETPPPEPSWPSQEGKKYTIVALPCAKDGFIFGMILRRKKEFDGVSGPQIGI